MVHTVVWCLQAQNFQEAKQQEFAQLKPSRDKQFQAEAYIQDRVLINLLQKDRKWVLSPNMLRGYLWDQTIPVDGAQASCVMLSHSHYVLIDKILYHLELDNPYPMVDWEETFLEAHCGPFSGHLGDAKIHSQLSRHYWWPGMRQEITHVGHVQLQQYGFRARRIFPSYFHLFLLRASLDQSQTSTKQKTKKPSVTHIRFVAIIIHSVKKCRRKRSK